MMALALLSLILCLPTQTIKGVESFPVPSAAASSSYTGKSIPSTSAAAYAKRSINFHLAQTSDDNDNGNEKETDNDNDNDNNQIVDYSSSLASEVIDFDWKAIANYVFDDSIKGKDNLHTKPVILFDGICNLCNGGVNFAIDHDSTEKFRFASLQSNVAKSLLLRDGKDPFTTSDVVLVTPEKTYYSSEAVARIMAALDMPVIKFFGIMGQITPAFARKLVYRVVSGNRFVLGENDSCRMDFDGEYTRRFVSDPPESIASATEEEEKDDE